LLSQEEFVQDRSDLNGIKGFIKVLTDIKLWAFGIAAFLVTLPWFWIVTQTYGNPLHFPTQEGGKELMAWLELVRSRPWYTYPVDIVFQNPLMGFALCSFFISFGKKGLKFFLAGWFLIFYIALMVMVEGKENRYMLPAYPALAIMASVVLYRCRDIVNRITTRGLGDAMVLVLLAVSSVWSIKIANHYTFAGFVDWIPLPF
jgi:4-amino-4-deoxy-L-arabinose transferase-like glycosyltransferase